MDEVNCPYCDGETNIDTTDFLCTDVRYEVECKLCDKNFVFEVEYDAIFTAGKADCLNGEEHEFIDYHLNNEKCIYCGKEQIKGGK